MIATAPLLNLDLLSAILAAPEDAGPRLAMADWLLENAGSVPCPRCSARMVPPYEWTCPTCHGTDTVPDGRAEYAEFIRVQCELARLETGADEPIANTKEELDRLWQIRDERIDAIQQQSRELVNVHRETWFPLIPGLLVATETESPQVREDPPGWAYARRGFVDSLTTDWRTWHGEEGPQVWADENGDVAEWNHYASQWQYRGADKNYAPVEQDKLRLVSIGRTEGIAPQLVRLSDPCGECWQGLATYDGEKLTACEKCDGSGRVLRAVQPGMQPITRVVFSDRGYPSDLFALCHFRPGERKFTLDDYPGIEFELPGMFSDTTRPAAAR